MPNRYSMIELTFKGPDKGNPFTDVDFYAVFQHLNEKRFVPGFYDGDGVYKLRFLPLDEGEWSYLTYANVPELNGLSGELSVEAALPGSHGPVVVKDKFHFAYHDGEKFFPVGTTAYAWTSQEPWVVEQTLKTLSENPFNKIRMSPFPKHYLYNLNEPPMYPFMGGLKEGEDGLVDIAAPGVSAGEISTAYDFDFDTPNVEFWRFFEAQIGKLQELGIEADLILFHPYDRWGFSTMSHLQNLRYIRYVVARLGAFPNIWWSMANEWDLFRGRTVEQWESLAEEIVRWDSAEHLRSIHNCTKLYDYSRGWITHVSIQRISYHSHVELVADWREQWQKPVVVDEICYEGDIDSGFGNITGEELTKRFWDITIRGGYATHGETYLRDDEIIWWAKGGFLTGDSPKRIGFMKKILEELPGYLDPRANNDWDLWWGVSGRRRKFLKKMGQWGVNTVEYAETMLCYFSFARPRFRIFDLPEDISYKIDIIDTWNMTVTSLPGSYSGQTRVELPAKEFIAVRFTAENW